MNTNRFLVFLLFLWPVFFPSTAKASETVDLYMTKAVYAMSIGDDARAFSWFGKVLAVEPENVTALHLQGVTASRLGRFAMAETILKKCIEQEDARPEAHFDLGFVLYSQGRYREATVQFNIAKRQGLEEPSLPYYLGASLFRLREYENAVESLELALQTVPEVEANTRFYLGASYYMLRKYHRSQKNLEKTLELGPAPPTARQAELLLEATIRDRALAKWWNIRFEMGAVYDSNIIYEPDELEVTDQAGFYGFTAFEGMVYPLKTRAGTLGAGYDYYQSFHYAPEGEVFGDFDLQRHAGQLEGLARLIGGYPGLYLGADYEISYASLGGQHYQDQHEVTPNLTVIEASAYATRLGTTIQSKRFPDYQERDGLFVGPTLAQLFNFMQGRGKAAVEVGYQQNDAESDDYDYQGVKAYAGALIPTIRNLYTIAGFQYRYLHFLNSSEDRLDRKVTTDLGLRYTLLEFFTFQLSYRYAQNTSVERYTWQKHVTSLSFQVNF